MNWGQAVNGLQGGVAIKRRVDIPGQGESVDGPWTAQVIEFQLRNVSDRPIRIIEPFVYCQSFPDGGAPLVDAEFITDSGRTYRIGLIGPPWTQSGSVVELQPGQSYSVPGQFGSELRLAPEFWNLTPPLSGECMLTYQNDRKSIRTIGPAPDQPGPEVDVWAGELQTGLLSMQFLRAGAPSTRP